MADVAIAGMAVTYIRSTGEHVPTTIIGASTRGDDFFHVKYMGMSTSIMLLWTVAKFALHAKGVKWVPVRVRERYILSVPRAARKHGLV